jgi:beta-phosphoglucomutase-like phosphatase (HAD superfamily)
MKSLSLDLLPSLKYLRKDPPSQAEYREMFRKQGAVHWDIDGVAAENEHVHVQSWIEVAANYGVKLTNEMFDVEHNVRLFTEAGKTATEKRFLRGSSTDFIAFWILSNHYPDIWKVSVLKVRAEVAKIKEAHLAGLLKNEGMIKPREGVEDVFEALHDEGFIQGAVTGSVRPIFEANMRSLQKMPPWDYVVTKEETTRHKREPDPYFLGLEKTAALLGIDTGYLNETGLAFLRQDLAKRSVSVEDGLSGVEASLNAGIPCVQFILPSQALFTKELPERPLDKYVHIARTGAELTAQIRKVAGSFTPTAFLL